jgi:HK97 family phage major capsid protein
MRKSFEIKQDRTAKQDELKALQKKAETENRGFTAEENTAWDAGTARVVELNAELKRAEEAEALDLEIARRTANPVITDKGDGEGDEKRSIFERFSINRALRAANPSGKDGLTGAEKEVHEIGLEEQRNAGVKESNEVVHLSLPMSFLNRATQQTVTQDSGAYGGAFVQNAAPVIVDPLRPRLWLENLGATFMTGLKGNVPLVVASDFDMSWLAEGVSITVQKKQFAGPTLSPKRAGGAVSITNQLIMQSSPDAEALVMAGLRNGFAKLLNSAALNGAGGVAPTGLLNISGVLPSAQVAGGAATWATIVELEGLIESADATENSLGWVMHPKLKAALKQIKKDAGSGRFLLEGNELEGQKYISTTLMPILSSGTLYPLLYGDFSQVFIGQWGSVNIKLNPYSEDLADSVRLALNTHADLQVANPASFAKNAFLTV